MATYRKKGSTVFTMDFQFQGQRIKESTQVRTKALADRVERMRRQEMEEGRAGFIKPKPAQTFASVAAEFMEREQASLQIGQTSGRAASLRIHRQNLAHLVSYFGKMLLCDITPLLVGKYQGGRTMKGAKPTTVNNELGTFRSVTTESGHWARLLPRVRMLEVDYEVGRCLSGAEVDALLAACQISESRLLYPIVLLLLETGSRSGTVLSLTWGAVDFAGRGLRWGRDKTKSGTRRTIPVSQRALALLEVWAENFPDRKPSDFVFPSERYRQPKDGERGQVSPYTSDPTCHVTSVSHSWRTAHKRTAAMLALHNGGEAAPPMFHARFHDLRHTACSRMIVAGIPIPVIAQLVGWSPTTMWEMAKKYGHYSQDDLRVAVESISAVAGSPLKSPPFTPTQPYRIS